MLWKDPVGGNRPAGRQTQRIHGEGTMSETSWLEIDLSAVDRNLARVRRAIGPDCGICAVVKADAYGLGAAAIAKRLASQQIDLLAVFSPAQAAELVRMGIPTPLLILMPVDQLERTDSLYRAAVANRLHLTLHGERQLDAVDAIGRQFGIPMPVHLELDSGMSRGGMGFEEAESLLERIAALRYVRLAGLFTHPSSADVDMPMTNRQLHLLDVLIERNAELIPPETFIHFANTPAMLRDRKYHRSMVRIGLGLFGYGQSAMRGSKAGGVEPLEPAVRWMSRVVHVREVPRGTPVGYGGTFRTYRDSRLGLVPVGYADGYPLSLSGRASVRVGEALEPAEIRGALNMDQLIVDLTELPHAGVGSPVEIFSDDPDAPNALPTLASTAKSSCYELLCRLSPRLTRHYVTTAASIDIPAAASPLRMAAQ